jgi:hypothetical protein
LDGEVSGFLHRLHGEIAGRVDDHRPLATDPGDKAVQEGSCDETPFGRMIFRFSILHWHFATEIAHKPSV